MLIDMFMPLDAAAAASKAETVFAFDAATGFAMSSKPASAA